MRRAIFTTMVAQTQHWSSAKKLLVVIPAVLFIAAHGFLITWGSMNLSGKIGGWFPWIAGATLLAFGLYHVISQFRSKGHEASHSFETHRHERHPYDGRKIERGAHGGFLVSLGHGFAEITLSESDGPSYFRVFLYDKNQQELSVLAPRVARATVSIETVRPDGRRQTFAFHSKGECLESTDSVPEPHTFNAIFRLSHGEHTHTHEVQF